jgi:hypothetical protein
MPGFVVHLGAVVLCSHAGPATPMAPNPRVLVSGQPIVTMQSPYVVTGCAQVAALLPPCVTAQWIMGATRLLSNGAPVVLQDSLSVCTPTATPLLVVATQIRATGM